MKNFLLAFLLLVPIVCSAQTTSTINRTIATIVDIDWALSEEHQGHCTGIQVGIQWVLTADHCLPPSAERADVTVNGDIVRVIKRNSNLDLALLEAASGDRPIIVIRTKAPQIGEPVTAVGYADAPRMRDEGINPLVLRRSIARVGSNGYIYTDGTFIGGMSGGPVVDADGKLIGVIRQGWDKVNIGGVIPASAIKKFIDGK